MGTDGKSPGFWFYPADFERDFQILSMAAQGLGIRMMCWMHNNEARRGFLELPTREPMSTEDIAAKIGKPVKEVAAAIREMDRIGLFSRDERGCLYSRRMARETHISEVRRAAALRRQEKSKRAADGTFAGDFAGAKQPAKSLQTPTVTAAVSASASDASAALPPLAKFPHAAEMVLHFFPSTDGPMVAQVIQSALHAFVGMGAERDPDAEMDDEAIALLIREAHKPKQHSVGLFLRTVPEIVRNYYRRTECRAE